MKLLKIIYFLLLVLFFTYKSGYIECNDNHPPVYGSVHSDKFHQESCVSRRNIKDENLVIFKNEFEASDNGYVACKNCFYFYYI